MTPPSVRRRNASWALLLSLASLFAACASDAAPAVSRKAATTSSGKTAAGGNAFAALLEASQGLKDVKKVAFAISRTHDSASDPDDREYTAGEMAQLVDENQSVLAGARRALTLPYTPPPIDDISAKFPYFAKFRQIARLFALDAKVKEAHGEWAEALDSRLDAVALGEKIQAHTVIIGSLVGAACELIGMRPSWANVDHLTAAESQAAAHRLATILAGHPPFAETLANERRTVNASLPSLYRAKDPVAAFETDDEPLPDDEIKAFKQAFAELHRVGLAAAQRDYLQASAAAIRRISGPWKAPAQDEPAPGKLLLTRILLSIDYPKIRFKVLLVETEARLLLTELALHAYHESNGSYPETLQALVPAYLKAVPDDPFSANDTLKYGFMGNGALVYSIGPDGVDDAGQAINDPNGKDEIEKHLPDMDSVGDIVAGVNI